MPVRYIAITRDGKRVKGVLEIHDEEEAEKVLSSSGLLVIKLKKERAKKQKTLLPTILGPKQRDILMFVRGLSSLLESGITIPASLRILRDETRNSILRDAIYKISLDVESGVSLSRAVSKYPFFPPMLSKLISIGEETGDLPTMLRRVAESLEKSISTRDKIKRALTYPILVLLVGGIAVFLIMNFALPALTGLFKELGAELSLVTRLLINIGDILKAKGTIILLSLFIVIILILALLRTKPGRRMWASVSLKLPVLGRALNLALLERLCSNLHLLLASGITLPEALDFSAKAIDNPVYEEKIRRAREEILKGSPFGKALEKASFPSLLVQSASVGEETGKLDENLKKLSEIFKEEADRAVQTATSLIEPAIIIALGGVVAFIAIGVVSSLYSLMGQIK